MNRRREKDHYPISQPSTAPIGHGTSAVVYRARSTSNGRRKVAVKVYTREEEGEILRERESRVLLALPPHPNIVRLIRNVSPRTWLTPSFSCPYGALIFRDAGESLRSIMAEPDAEKRSRPWLLHLFQQIMGAVAHMHASFVSHGDLKPDNIMVKVGGSDFSLPHATLIDFGHARLLPYRGVKITARELSPEYAAPEVVEAWMSEMRSLPSVPYDPMVADVWSVGCIGYFMLNSGKLPTDEIVARPDVVKARDMLLDHRRHVWPWPALPGGRDAHTSLVMRMLDPLPVLRPALQQCRSEAEEDRMDVTMTIGAGSAPTGPGAGADAMTLSSIPEWTRMAD